MSLVSKIVLVYLRFFAKLSLKLHKPTVIGITGSVGKSSTRNLIYAVLEDHFPTKMISKGNSETGIPLGILGLIPKNYSYFDWIRLLVLSPFGLNYLSKTKYLILEMGIDEPYPPKNMQYLLSIVKPTISVFLNVHPVHTMQFEKSITNILNTKKLNTEEKLKLLLIKISEEKGKIITNNNKCEIAIYNSNNLYINDLISKFKKNNSNKLIKFSSFGIEKSDDIIFKNFTADLKGSEFSFFSKKQSKDILINFKNYLLPEAYREGIASAILVGQVTGLNLREIQNSIISNLILPKSRATLFDGINNSFIIDSSYNSSKASTLSFLDLLKTLKNKYQDKPIVFLMGDMRELGENAKTEHEEVYLRLNEIVDYLFCVGPLTKEFIIDNEKNKNGKLNLKEIQWFTNSVQAGSYLKKNLPKNSIILVKGSQNTIFLEEAVKFILKNNEDKNKLCRQEDFWKKEKKYLYEV